MGVHRPRIVDPIEKRVRDVLKDFGIEKRDVYVEGRYDHEYEMRVKDLTPEKRGEFEQAIELIIDDMVGDCTEGFNKLRENRDRIISRLASRGITIKLPETEEKYRACARDSARRRINVCIAIYQLEQGRKLGYRQRILPTTI